MSFIDSNRALVTQLGPRQLPGQTWSRPLVTQHTTVGLQSAEKAEMVSQKMTITSSTGGTDPRVSPSAAQRDASSDSTISSTRPRSRRCSSV